MQINSMPVGMLQEKDIEEWSRTARDNGKDKWAGTSDPVGLDGK